MQKRISVANLVMLAGGAVTLLFSFFSFFKSEFSDDGFSAWNTDGFAFATAIPAILGLAMAAVCIAELAGAKLPDQILTYSMPQVKGTWGIAAAGTMLAWLTVGGDGLGKGIGFWFMFLGSIAMATGAVMGLLGKGSEIVDLSKIGGSATAPPPPGMGTPPPPPPPPGMGTPPPPPPA